MRYQIMMAITLACTNAATANGEVGLYFSGEVFSVFGNPFGAGITQSPPSHVAGRLLYDPTRPPTDPLSGCDCMGYRQHIIGGFTALVGNASLRADDYVLQIKNDLDHLDTLSVKFSGAFSPPLASPLLVNGVAHPAAWFQINLDAPIHTFADASLPVVLHLDGVTSNFNFLAETATADKPVLFRNTVLTTFSVSPGDYDGDGDVDSDDYVRWRSTTGSMSLLDADGNRNGVVDAADYVVWRRFVSPNVVAGMIPEPSIVFLLSQAGLAIRLGPRHRRTTPLAGRQKCD